MKKCLIIKINRVCLFNDSVLETQNKKYNSACSHLEKFAKERGAEFCISVNAGINWFDRADCLVDVYSTDELQIEEREFITEELKCFLLDKPFMSSPNGRLFRHPFHIFFHKLNAYSVMEID